MESIEIHPSGVQDRVHLLAPVILGVRSKIPNSTILLVLDPEKSTSVIPRSWFIEPRRGAINPLIVNETIIICRIPGGDVVPFGFNLRGLMFRTCSAQSIRIQFGGFNFFITNSTGFGSLNLLRGFIRLGGFEKGKLWNRGVDGFFWSEGTLG